MRDDLAVKQVTAKQATKSLTGFDLQAIRKTWKMSFQDIDNMDVPRVLIWVVENRGDKKMSWDEAMGLDLGECNEYFIPEEQTDPLDKKTQNES